MPYDSLLHNPEAVSDPLLQDTGSVARLDQQISRMIELRDQMRQQVQQQGTTENRSPQARRKKTVWDEIREELNDLTDGQKEILFADPEYQQRDAVIANIAAQYQMQLLIPYVLDDEDGRKALEAQLYTIRAKKDQLQAKERAELQEFKAWKEAKAQKARKTDKAE